jgi:hypothetical protein
VKADELLASTTNTYKNCKSKVFGNDQRNFGVLKCVNDTECPDGYCDTVSLTCVIPFQAQELQMITVSVEGLVGWLVGSDPFFSV